MDPEESQGLRERTLSDHRTRASKTACGFRRDHAVKHRHEHLESTSHPHGDLHSNTDGTEPVLGGKSPVRVGLLRRVERGEEVHGGEDEGTGQIAVCSFHPIQALEDMPQLGGVFGTLLAPFFKRWKDRRHHSGIHQEFQCRGGFAALHDAEDLLRDPGNGTIADQGRMPAHDFPELFWQMESNARSKFHASKNAYRILREADIRVADGAESKGLKILQPPHVVDDDFQDGVVEEAVDREITAHRILFRCSKRVGLFESLVSLLVARDQSSGAMTPERRDFKDRGPAVNMGQHKSTSDQSTVSEELSNLRGLGIRRDVEVLGGASEQKIPDASAHEVRGKTSFLQRFDDPTSVGIDAIVGEPVRQAVCRTHVVHLVSFTQVGV